MNPLTSQGSSQEAGVTIKSQPAALVSSLPVLHFALLNNTASAYNHTFLPLKVLNPIIEPNVLFPSRKPSAPTILWLVRQVHLGPPPQPVPISSLPKEFHPCWALQPPSSSPMPSSNARSLCCPRHLPQAAPSLAARPGVGRGPHALTAFFFLRLCRRLTTRSV